MILTHEERCWVWLCGVSGITPARFRGLLTHYGTAAGVFCEAQGHNGLEGIPEDVAERICGEAREERVESAVARLEEKNIIPVTQLHADYPQQFLPMQDAPATLYCMGDTKLLNYPRMVAMVGTRSPTHSGRKAAQMIAKELAENGVLVVSGMARGIDTYAHLGALDGEGHTIAVLGCGPDVVYPPENKQLYERILEKGLVVSEYLPGMQPMPGNFPVRNRIVSGISMGVIVVEAAQKSGTHSTVNFANDQGKDVFAVPGSIDSKMSAVPNQLLKEGARIVTDAQDVLDNFGWTKRTTQPTARLNVQLSYEEAKVMAILELGQATFDDIYAQADFTPPQLASLLTMMELKGLLSMLPGRIYSL